jgi:hypothetical protein
MPKLDPQPVAGAVELPGRRSVRGRGGSGEAQAARDVHRPVNPGIPGERAAPGAVQPDAFGAGRHGEPAVEAHPGVPGGRLDGRAGQPGVPPVLRGHPPALAGEHLSEIDRPVLAGLVRSRGSGESQRRRVGCAVALP